MDDSYIYHLSVELEYSKKGDFVKTASIEFAPPDMKVLDESTDFEQIIMSSILAASGSLKGFQDNKVEDEEPEEEKSITDMTPPTPAEMRMLLFATNEISVRDITKKFKKLAMKTGKLDNNEKLKESHFDKMLRNDFIDMMCGYASFFTFPSLLRGE